MRLLLIEDDLMIGESLVQALKGKGYAVDWVRDGGMGEESLSVNRYALVLLDLGLPGLSGLELLKRMRGRKDATPVLIMTARDAVTDRVAGLDGGADDYLVKPFALEELEARIRALLRRRAGQVEPLMVAGRVMLDPITRGMRHEERTQILSAREYALMFALMEVPGRILSRSELEDRLYGWDDDVSSNAVEFHIHQLRKKFGSGVIRNIRGLGYMVEK